MERLFAGAQLSDLHAAIQSDSAAPRVKEVHAQPFYVARDGASHPLKTQSFNKVLVVHDSSTFSRL